ncbi:MAG: Fe-S cluster assembly sulfur transfer protein SufU [Candidatus Omnitrophota bacterium]
MPDLKQLYQEMILDHNKNPRNFRTMEGATHHAEGYNPMCGDRYTVYVRLEEGKIADISFSGSGCAISKASASLMTSCLKGKTPEEAERIFDDFHHMLTHETAPEELPGRLCKIAALQGVKAFPTRIKCATLVWHTMKSALEGKEEPTTISTE